MLNIAPNKQRIVAIVSVILILLGLWLVWSYSRRRPAAVRAHKYAQREQLFRVIGQVAAEETAKLMGGKGRVVAVVVDDSGRDNALLREEWEGFLEGLRGQKGLQVVGTVKVDGQLVWGNPVFGLPASEFLRVLNEYPQADVIVSFAGCPKLTTQEIAELPAPANRPKVVVVEGMPMRGMRENNLPAAGLVQRAIVRRQNPQGINGTDVSPRALFEAQYEAITVAP